MGEQGDVEVGELRAHAAHMESSAFLLAMTTIGC